MKTWAIAQNTFKEAVRNKIFYLLVVFGILFAMSSRLLSILTVGDREKVLMDVGLAAINFFSVLTAIFTGINLVYKEIDKRTIFNILSKPISREHFLIGKFLGLALTLLVALSAMAAIFFAFLWLTTGGFHAPLLLYFLLLYLELLIITALSLLFSSFTTPILSSIFTISLYLIGHLTWTYNEFKYLVKNPLSQYVIKFLYYILPNLEKFNLKNAIVMQESVPLSHVLFAGAYAVLYILALLSLSMLIFHKKEFQ